MGYLIICPRETILNEKNVLPICVEKPEGWQNGC